MLTRNFVLRQVCSLLKSSRIFIRPALRDGFFRLRGAARRRFSATARF